MVAPRKPTHAEQLDALREEIKALEASFREADGIVRDPEIRQHLHTLETMLQELRWRPTKTEKPDDDRTVLGHFPKSKGYPVWPCWWDAGAGVWHDADASIWDKAPTHWRDFPTPPEVTK